MKFIFVGEKPSKKAELMGVTWSDGRLAAKQLFDAFEALGIDPAAQVFINLFGDTSAMPDKINPVNLEMIKALSVKLPVVGMGRKVQKELKKAGVDHIQIFHPATRGVLRRKEVYTKHIKESLLT